MTFELLFRSAMREVCGMCCFTEDNANDYKQIIILSSKGECSFSTPGNTQCIGQF
jgi:hypothetical protein